MKRVALTDGSGRWFDADKAEMYEEKTFWNGSNHISKATGIQWNHEKIYITAGGKFIMYSWSDYQGSRDTVEEISDNYAAAWFAKQEFDDDDIPEVFQSGVLGLEIK